MTLRYGFSSLLLVLPLAACGGQAAPAASKTPESSAPAAAPASGSLLVDDFEDGNGTSLLGGYWYSYVDRDNGGLSSLNVPRQNGGPQMVGEGFDSKHSLLGKYRMDQGKLPYPPYVGIGVSLQGPHRDLRSYGAIQYAYKSGSKHEVRIETANVEQYDFYAITLPPSTSWKTVTLDFSLFRQGGWAKKVPFLLDQAKALGWQVRGETGETGDFQIDNVRLLPAGTQTSGEPDLDVRAPEPPAPVRMDSLAISHPLQAVAKKSLDDGYNVTNWLEQKRFDGYGNYDESFVKKLASAGFKGLRLPIDLDLYVVKREKVGDRVKVEVHPDLFKVLDDFDRWTQAHGLSLTIDYHQYDHSLDIDNPESTGEMVALWGKVAEHFAKSPRQDLFYELLNEPELSAKRGPSAAEWTKLAQDTIAAIRQYDPKRPILFGDVKWYGIDELLARQPFADPNIIYVFHFYEPFIFTHQGAPWAGLGTTHDVPYPYSPARWSKYQKDLGFTELNESWQMDQLHNYYRAGNRDALRNRLISVKSWAVKHNVPLICNEFGVHEAAARKEDVVRYYTDLIALFGELEIPWQVWFMIMDAKSGQVDPEYRKAFELQAR
jgi:licheninase